MNKRAIGILAVVASGLLLVVIFLIASELQKQTAPTDTSADTLNKLNVVQTSPAAGTKLTKGTTITIAVRPQILTTGKQISVAEVALSYDPSALRGARISEANGLIGLNKNFNTSTGTATADLAISGTGSFPNNESIVEFEFDVLQSTTSSSIVKILSSSTLGVPNSLGTGSYGQLTLSLNPTSSSSTQSAAVSSSSATTTTSVQSVSSSSSSSTSTVGQVNRLSISITSGSTPPFKSSNHFVARVNAVVVSGSPSVAEIVLSFNKNLVQIKRITEASGLIGLNKTLDNVGGKAAIDVAATGGSKIANGATLVEMEFEVIATSAPSTPLQITSDSTLGVPNSLSASGRGSATVALDYHSGSNTTTIASSSSQSSQGQTSSIGTSTSSQESSTESSSSSETFSSESFSSSSETTFSISSSVSSTASTTSSTSTAEPQDSVVGIDPRVVVYGLFGVSAAAGVTALYLFNKREVPPVVS